MLTDALELEGYHVVTAGHGELALRLARMLHPDVLVLDMLLPGLSGLEVAGACYADPATHAAATSTAANRRVPTLI